MIKFNLISETECNKPPSLENSKENIDWVFEGIHLPRTQIKYTCNEKFLLNPPEYKGIVCGENGTYGAFDEENSNGTCVRGCYLVFV